MLVFHVVQYNKINLVDIQAYLKGCFDKHDICSAF